MQKRIENMKDNLLSNGYSLADKVFKKLEEEMRAAAAALQFEQAAKLRDRLFELKVML